MLWNDNKSSSNLDLKIIGNLVLNSYQGEECFLEVILWFIHVMYLLGTQRHQWLGGRGSQTLDWHK